MVGSLVVIGTGGLGAGLIPTTLTGAIGLAVAVDGIADILNSVIAFATGRPIMDLDAHFKSKGIGYAITAITMGLQSIYGKLAEKFPKLAKYQAAWTKPGAGKALDAAGKELSKQAIKESVIGAIKEQFVKQGLIKTFTYLASAAGGSILKDYRQEVEDGVSKEITALIKSLQAELDKILSDDAWHHTRARQAELHFEAVRILERSQEGYRSAGLEIASGVASNLVPGAKIMIEGIKLAESLEKVLALTRQFTHVFRQVIQMRASDVQPNTFMLVDIMQKSKRLSEGNIASILKTLTSSRILVENAVSCGVTDCAKIMDMTGLTVPSQHVVNKACMDVYKVVCADYADRRIALREELVDRITDTIIHLIQGELINPVSGLGVSYGVNTIFDRLKAAKTGLEEDAAKAQQAKQPPAPLKKARLRTGATTPSAGLIETEVLAHTNKLKVPIEIYRDGKFAKLLGAEHSHFLRTPIKVNYNTLTRMWTMPGDPNYVGTDSVFEVISRQTLHLRTPQTPAQLREFVTDYTNKHSEFTREAMFKRFHDIISGASPSVPDSNPDSLTYKVFKGDTVDSIARKHGLTTEQLIRANLQLEARTRINSAGQTIIKILPGEQIAIPAPDATQAAQLHQATRRKPAHNPEPAPGSPKSGPLIMLDGSRPTLKDIRRRLMARYNRLIPDVSATEMSVLKDAVAQQLGKIKDHLTQEKLYNFKLEFPSGDNDDERGFFGGLFSKTFPDGRKVYIEMFKDTNFLGKDNLNTAMDFYKDLVGDDINLFKLQLPEQVKSAEAFHARVMAHIGHDSILYVGGFSLGNALSQIMGAKLPDDYKAVAGFDGPGMKEVIERRVPKANLERLSQKTVLLQTRPHMINVHGTHILEDKDVIVLDTDTDEIPSGVSNAAQMAAYTLKTHDKGAITRAIQIGIESILNLGRLPRGIGTLRESFYDYGSNKAEWDARIFKDWQSNTVVVGVPHPLMTPPARVQNAYESFEAYKKASIQKLNKLKVGQ